MRKFKRVIEVGDPRGIDAEWCEGEDRITIGEKDNPNHVVTFHLSKEDSKRLFVELGNRIYGTNWKVNDA